MMANSIVYADTRPVVLSTAAQAAAGFVSA